MRAAPPMADYRTKTSLLSTATALVPQQFDKIVHRALRDLALAKDPAELVRIADIADALRFCAKRARLGLAAQNKAAAVRLWAERGIGEILAKTARHAGGRPSMKPVLVENGFSPARLRELGIDRKLSSRAQRLAEIPKQGFARWIEDAQQRQLEINTRDLLNLHDRRTAAAKNRERIIGGRVSDLVEFASAGHRMGTIYLDPPWPFTTVLPYEPIQIHELRSLPIAKLAAERCHIHMWATGINFQFVAKEILENWGFRIVGDFVWVKPALGGRNYWRQSHETLLTAVRQDSADRFDDHSLRSWVEAPRARHSEKPEIVRELIERASPAPRLEIFARKLTPGWFSWGHEARCPIVRTTCQREA
jgi:N6-adenosine-specific RNA methylase IME4